MTLCIRPVGLEDWPMLRSIFLASRQVMFPKAAPGSFQLTDLDQQTQSETILIAEASLSNGARQTIGFISIQEIDHFIHHLMVDASMQGKGVGRRLLRSLPDWGHAKYRLKCLCSNTQATAFYLACGFLLVDTGVDVDGEFAVFQFAPRA